MYTNYILHLYKILSINGVCYLPYLYFHRPGQLYALENKRYTAHNELKQIQSV